MEQLKEYQQEFQRSIDEQKAHMTACIEKIGNAADQQQKELLEREKRFCQKMIDDLEARKRDVDDFKGKSQAEFNEFSQKAQKLLESAKKATELQMNMLKDESLAFKSQCLEQMEKLQEANKQLVENIKNAAGQLAEQLAGTAEPGAQAGQ